MRSLYCALILLSTATLAEARYDCGRVQRAHYGLSSDFNLARNWARKLPHTTAHAGAVVVQSRNGRDSAGHPGGHVSRIIEMRGTCSALVADEKGHYVRDICSRLIAYVDPNGNGIATRERRQRHATVSYSPQSSWPPGI